MRSFGNAPSVMCLLMGVALLSPTHAVAAQTPVTARVVGQVYDSIAAAPLPNALVRLFRPDDPSVGINARTDERGMFAVPELPGGVWVASFAHARLDSLRLEAPLARVAIVESGTIPLTLAIASASSVAWPEWVFAKKSTVREEVRRTARTDREARYVLCGAARHATLGAVRYGLDYRSR